ncbi:MAG: DUF4235 domain-containing protein [Chitinivibrionales bacterium]
MNKLKHCEQKWVWTVIATGMGMITGLAVHATLKNAWRTVKKHDPPSRLDKSTWAETIAWSALSGIISGMMKMLAEQAAAAGWTKATGTPPPEKAT